MKKVLLIFLATLFAVSCTTEKQVVKEEKKVEQIIVQKTDEETLIENASKNEAAGLEAFKKGENDKALSLLELAIKGKKDTFEVYSATANIYYLKKDYKKAEESFIKARSINNSDNAVNLVFGNMLIELKRFTEAKEIFEDAFAKDAKFAEAGISLISIYKELMKTEKDKGLRDKLVKKAEEFAQKSLSEIPGSAAIYVNLSQLYYEADKKPLAFYTLSVAEKNEPDSPIVLNNLGWYYEKENNAYLAKIYYDKALKKNENYIPALKNKVRIQMQSLNYKESKDLFEKILKAEPNNQQAMFGIGLCYLGQFEFENAIKYFDNLFQKTSDDKYMVIVADIYYKQLAANDKYIEKPKERKEFLVKAQEWYNKYKTKYPSLGADSDIIVALNDIDMQIKAIDNPEELKEPVKEDEKKEVDKDKLEELKKRMEEEGKTNSDGTTNTDSTQTGEVKTDSKEEVKTEVKAEVKAETKTESTVDTTKTTDTKKEEVKTNK